jgi:RNA polymerase sigma factor (sigma-70 family)
MDGARPLDPAELLAQVNWVRRLARALVRDADAAEDLAQETLRVTLEQPGGRVGGGVQLRAWLQRVARRLALDRWRADASRAQRERAVAPREPTEGTFEVVARSSRQQQVVAAVHELAEPYRSTILYRYLDELSTREVAKRMEVTEELVRKRLSRALAQLRERLDAEFGSDTKSWALALLSLPGAAVVGVKAKVAVAAVVMIAAAMTWKELSSTAARRPSDSPATSTISAPATASAPAPVTVTLQHPGDPIRSPISPLAPSSDATVLHVAVVDADHHPRTSGRLTGFWSEETRLESPQTREVRVIEADIAGATTDLVLPAVAASALLSASVDGQPPSPIESIARLRTEEDPKTRHGRVERDVTLVVAGGVERPRLSGCILVDGRPRVPRGLVITTQRPAAVRIHALDARYSIGPVDWALSELFVTSDETVPRCFATGFTHANPPNDENTLDLDLSSGVTLRLNVLDRRSAAPLPGIELYLRIDSNPEGQVKYGPRMFQHHIVSGADGVAVVTGLPRGGGFSVRRDATLRKRRMEMLPQPPQEEMLPREALLAESFDAATPAVVERTLRIDAEDRTLHVFGDLDATFLTPGEFGEADAEVRFANRGGDILFWIKAGPDEMWLRSIASVPYDERGHWKFEAETGVDYRVWVEREHRRISQIASVRPEDGDVGPVALEPRPGTDVLLRIVHCPKDGTVVIFVHDVDRFTSMGTQYPTSGGTLERRLRLEGSTAILVSASLLGARLNSLVQRELDVDPATTSVVEVDLAADEMRDVTLELGAGELPAKSRLFLMRTDADGSHVTSLAAQVAMAGGASVDPVAVNPGRYVYMLSSTPHEAALVLGVIDIERGSEGGTLSLRCDLEAHPKSELGAGLEITEIAGVRPEGRPPYLQRLRFADEPALATAETIYIPKDAKFTVLEK